MSGVDATVVSLHRLAGPIEVEFVQGEAFFLDKDGRTQTSLAPGTQLKVGDTIFVAPHAQLRGARINLSGGARGGAHSFVAMDAFRSGPARKDVPKLLRHLEQIEGEFERLGEDPMAEEKGPVTEAEHIYASDFALSNLVMAVALLLPEDASRRLRAVPLFLHNDTAVVASHGMELSKLRELTEVLGRPVSMHLVGAQALERLWKTVYRAPN